MNCAATATTSNIVAPGRTELCSRGGSRYTSRLRMRRPLELTTMRSITLFSLLLISCSFAAPLSAQAPEPQPSRDRCSVVPDTARVPTRLQVRDMNRLRDSVVAVLRAAGHPGTGLLFVDIDTMRRGRLLFLETDLPTPVVQRATRHVATHLEGLESGKAYKALLRLDGEYPVIGPKKRFCQPELDNPGDLMEMRQKVLDAHPASRALQPLRATLSLVVGRDGKVLWAAIDRPTGDAFIDEHLNAIAYGLRFLPASLDGVPFDFRTTFSFLVNPR